MTYFARCNGVLHALNVDDDLLKDLLERTVVVNK